MRFLLIIAISCHAFAFSKKVMDVETLNDNLVDHANKRVTVEGKIRTKLDERSYILKSGSIVKHKKLVNDEIVIILGKDIDKKRAAQLAPKKKVTVRGTVYASYLGNSEFLRYFIWDTGKQYEGKPFIVAEEIVD